MISLLLYCVTIAWDAASGPVSTYTLYLDGGVHQEGIIETQASVCLSDDVTHTVTVQAFDVDGISGPMSDASEVIQMVIAPPFKAIPLDPVIRADFDGNGTVGWPDFFIWSGEFSKRHDGIQEIP